MAAERKHIPGVRIGIQLEPLVLRQTDNHLSAHLRRRSTAIY